MSDNDVRRELVARMLVAHRPPISVLTRFTYRRKNPWEVEFEFRTHTEWVPWVMARELLAAGINGQADNHGDVHIYPNPNDHTRTRMELSSPAGEALFEFDTSELVELLALTTHLVPFGAEDYEVDWSAELATLTAQE